MAQRIWGWWLNIRNKTRYPRKGKRNQNVLFTFVAGICTPHTQDPEVAGPQVGRLDGIL